MTEVSRTTSGPLRSPPTADSLRSPRPRRGRFARVAAQKTQGATYTPQRLADFVAAKIVGALADRTAPRTVRILDPACGDGELLESLLRALPEESRRTARVVGFDTDERAVQATQDRLRESFPDVDACIERRDFLELALELESRASDSCSEVEEAFDLVIANPPYVRTQILGAARAQAISRAFGFKGRVDLYFPFLLGISRVLAPSGVAGVIVSNRFMTTRSGGVLRRELLARFRVRHVWDLGDTRLFDAAVLPAVLLAHGVGADELGPPRSSSIYACEDSATELANDALSALDRPAGSVVAIGDGRRFRVEHGTLDGGAEPSGVWRIASAANDAWLAAVDARTWKRFADLGRVHVGVKTTADRVFIRSDWDALPASDRPELLRPLTTRRCARRFRALESDAPTRILYPHESTPNGRAPSDLARHPRSARYLERHRAELEARSYVIAAGRRWYEIWVPQDPAAWSDEKLVFLDIAERPTFWIDREGTVVSGECYWLRCENGVDPGLLWLALAVANSSFIESFYDRRFHNKLYAGRRRFITQYVEEFPLPDASTDIAREMRAKAERIHALTPSIEAEELSRALDALVWRAFGLPADARARPRHSGGSS
jgi:hypothetical protein